MSIQEDVGEVVSYSWGDEMKHFCEGDHDKDHIFLNLRRLNKAFNVGMAEENCGDKDCPLK